MTAIEARPRVGKLVVPFMVDATREPIDFKVLDSAHVDACAERGLCGICGSRIRRGPIAFIGPNDGRQCFADPWMHRECAELALEQCPFLTGRRDWREPGGPLLEPYRPGTMTIMLAINWRAHRDAFGHWHFEAIGGVLPASSMSDSVATGQSDRATTRFEDDAGHRPERAPERRG